MKLYLSLLIATIVVFFSFSAKAQVHVDMNVNIGGHPDWCPSGGQYVEYYYMPEIGVYYNVPRSLFFYTESGCWVSRRSLPYRYRNYDLYRGYKVAVNEHEPWRRHSYYEDRYSYNNRHDRDDDDRRYYDDESRGRGHGNGHHDNGKHLGWYKHGKH